MFLSFFPLEDDLQRELDLAGTCSGFGDSSSTGVSERGGDKGRISRPTEIGSIQYVEKLRSKLQITLLIEVDVLLKRKVKGQNARHL